MSQQVCLACSRCRHSSLVRENLDLFTFNIREPVPGLKWLRLETVGETGSENKEGMGARRDRERGEKLRMYWRDRERETKINVSFNCVPVIWTLYEMQFSNVS